MFLEHGALSSGLGKMFADADKMGIIRWPLRSERQGQGGERRTAWMDGFLS